MSTMPSSLMAREASGKARKPRSVCRTGQPSSNQRVRESADPGCTAHSLSPAGSSRNNAR